MIIPLSLIVRDGYVYGIEPNRPILWVELGLAIVSVVGAVSAAICKILRELSGHRRR